MKAKRNYNLNLGIQILRTILCFWVLSFHCLEAKNLNYFLFYITKTKFYHVPCFAFISFYYSYNVFFSENNLKMKNRLERLLISYIIWPLIFFIYNNLFIPYNKYTFHHLLLQLICGRQLFPQFWYLFSMITLTILFYILIHIFKKNFVFIIELLSIFVYIIQYSRYDKIFYKYNMSISKPIIDTISIFPLSSIGLIFASKNLINVIKNKRKHNLFITYIFIFFLIRYDLFSLLEKFKGIEYFFSSVCFFVGFYLLPLENINLNIKKILIYITSYTNGIYCLHIQINIIKRKKFCLNGTFKNCIIIYLLSYFVSFIGMKIFGNIKLKYLFI